MPPSKKPPARDFETGIKALQELLPPLEDCINCGAEVEKPVVPKAAKRKPVAAKKNEVRQTTAKQTSAKKSPVKKAQARKKPAPKTVAPLLLSVPGTEKTRPHSFPLELDSSLRNA